MDARSHRLLNVDRARRADWLAALSVAAIVAVPLTSTIIRFTGLQRSIWVRVVAGDDDSAPPRLRVRYGDLPSQTLPVSWDEAAPHTLLGLRADRPVTLLSIDTDRGVVPPWLAQTWAPDWTRMSHPPGLLVRGSGMVDAQGTFRRLTLTFAPGDATVDVGWLDRRATLRLSPDDTRPRSVTLEASEGHRGWVLLPPQRIDRLWIETSDDAKPTSFSVREVAVAGPRPQVWSSGSGAVGALDAGVVALAGVRPLNVMRAPTRAGIWAAVVAIQLGSLWVIACAAQRIRAFSQRFEFTESRLGRIIRERTNDWTVARVAAGVIVAGAVYHLSYVYSVPTHFTYDSLGYYAYGHDLLNARRLDAIGTCRTPGYPGAVALSILLFENPVRGLALIQHLAFCALGALVVWVLYPRIGAFWSGFAGLLVAVSPIMSITANMVWTEPLFIVFSTGALLVFIHGRGSRVMWAAAGLLAGAATLIRPNGVVILALMLSWLFLAWWCALPRARVASMTATAAIVSAGFAIVIAPWMVHFHRAAGHWALTDPDCAQEGQTHAARTSALTPTNIFQLAAFVNLISQNDAVGSLPIAEPHRAFYDFFPARHRYYVGTFVPWDLVYDDRYTGEMYREYLRAFPSTYMRQVRDALVFNLTHLVTAGPLIFRYSDVEDALTFQRARLPVGARPEDPRVERLLRAPTLSWSDAEVLLSYMTAAPTAGPGVWRQLHLRVNAVALSSWGLLTMLAAGATVFCVFAAGYRSFILLSMHALAVSAAPAVLGMAADRFAFVGESALYVLIGILLSFTLSHRWRQRR
jgi:hypothetical protein